MSNSLIVIAPYWYEGVWAFDDPSVGLRREPFVMGMNKIITRLVADIPNAKEGFRLLFSASPFPGVQAELEWVREEIGGNWYRSNLTGTEGWLCPALFKYFDKAPPKLYLRAEPKTGE